MSNLEKSIDVNVPAHKAYNQWTQFEQFPKFMEGVISVQQIDDRRLRWRTNIGGVEKSFEAEITEQIVELITTGDKRESPKSKEEWACVSSQSRHSVSHGSKQKPG